MQKVLDFIMNKSGQFSVIMGLSLFTLVGTVGLSVDYLLLSKEKTYLQNEADRLALERRNGEWLSDTEYKVELSEEKKTYFISVLGITNATVSVKSVVHVAEPVYTYHPPTFSTLEGEAYDFNIIGFYCYSSTTNTRTNFTEIANNRGGTSLTTSVQCKPGETVEYYMWNSRYGTGRSTYQNGVCTRERFEAKQCRTNVYFTDKGTKNTLRSDIADHAGERNAIVETILCDTLAACLKPNCTTGSLDCLNYEKDGGKIPNKQRYRKPREETQECSPGKYKFYGFEDRLAVDGDYADNDYDDIILIVPCPSVTTVSGKKVYLIK